MWKFIFSFSVTQIGWWMLNNINLSHSHYNFLKCGMKLIIEVMCWLLITQPITLEEVWNKNQSGPGWHQLFWHSKTHKKAKNRIKCIVKSIFFNGNITERLVDETVNLAGSLLLNPVMVWFSYICIQYNLDIQLLVTQLTSDLTWLRSRADQSELTYS